MVQVPVTLLIIHAVANDKHIGNLESTISDGQIDQSSCGLVEQGTNFDARRIALLERLQKIRTGQPRVDDVLDQQNISSFDALIKILGYSHDARLSRVTRYGHEVDIGWNGDVAEQIGGENERAAEHRDDGKVFSLVSLRDFHSKL